MMNQKEKPKFNFWRFNLLAGAVVMLAEWMFRLLGIR